MKNIQIMSRILLFFLLKLYSGCNACYAKVYFDETSAAKPYLLITTQRAMKLIISLLGNVQKKIHSLVDF